MTWVDSVVMTTKLKLSDTLPVWPFTVSGVGDRGVEYHDRRRAAAPVRGTSGSARLVGLVTVRPTGTAQCRVKRSCVHHTVHPSRKSDVKFRRVGAPNLLLTYMPRLWAAFARHICGQNITGPAKRTVATICLDSRRRSYTTAYVYLESTRTTHNPSVACLTLATLSRNHKEPQRAQGSICCLVLWSCPLGGDTCILVADNIHALRCVSLAAGVATVLVGPQSPVVRSRRSQIADLLSHMLARSHGDVPEPPPSVVES